MSYDVAGLQKFLHGLSCLLAVQIRTNVTAKILRLRLTQRLSNYRVAMCEAIDNSNSARRMINTRLITVQGSRVTLVATMSYGSKQFQK